MPSYYHYTSLDSAMSIVESGSIWATNILYLNDEREYIDALDFISDNISKIDFPTDVDPIVRDDFIALIKGFVNILNPLTYIGVPTPLYAMNPILKIDNYVCSFSRNGDLLSQWRSYCSPDNGYNINVNIDSVLKDLKISFPGVLFLDCIYESKEKLNKLSKLITDNIYEFPGFYSKSSSNETKGFITRYRENPGKMKYTSGIINSISELCLIFKDSSFCEEEEIRLIVQFIAEDSNNVQFRKGRNCIIPYLKIPIDIDCIEGLTLGPTSNRKLAYNSLLHFLRHMYRNREHIPKVLYSSVPFRII